LHIVLGGTGRVGSATTRALLDLGEPVIVVTRDENRGAALKHRGAQLAIADIRDVDGLRAVFRGGKCAFLLNPPADPSGDTDAEERATVAAIIEALSGSGLEKLVAQSTYGARPGARCGDLTVLYEFEQRLAAQSIPAMIHRGAYYMSNWAGMLDAVRETGRLPSFFPGDLSLPMVSPDDLGLAAALRLTEPVTNTGTLHIEGPQRYTPRDVAEAFSDALKRPVQVQEIPRGELEATFRRFGFSWQAAASYARMTRAVIDAETETADALLRGDTSLRDYVGSIVAQAG